MHTATRLDFLHSLSSFDSRKEVWKYMADCMSLFNNYSEWAIKQKATGKVRILKESAIIEREKRLGEIAITQWEAGLGNKPINHHSPLTDKTRDASSTPGQLLYPGHLLDLHSSLPCRRCYAQCHRRLVRPLVDISTGKN